MVLLASLGYARRRAADEAPPRRRLGRRPRRGHDGRQRSHDLPLALADLPSGAGADTIGSLLVLGAGGTGVAFLLYYTLIADVGPARASIVAYLAPVFAVLYGVALLDEGVLGRGRRSGSLLILAGSWLGAESRLPSRPRRLSRSAPSRSSAPAPARAR